MKWTTVSDYRHMSEYGADRLFRAVTARLDAGLTCNLGLATGNTMILLYELLADRLNQAGTDLSRLHTFNLDEYVANDRVSPVPPSHPLSYASYMHHNLFSRLSPERHFDEATQAHFPDPAHPDAFDQTLADAGNLYLQLLGIGFNGHIAFNEPMSPDDISPDDFAQLPTRVIALKELTIQTNARLTADGNLDTVPRYAATMGMRQILAARDILLLACFPEQTDPLSAIRRLDAPTPSLPASFILNHPHSEIAYTTDAIAL